MSAEIEVRYQPSSRFAHVPLTVLTAPVSPQAKALWAALASYAWNTGSCFPSQATLATMLSVDERTIRRWTRELEQVGMVATEHRDARKSIVYTLSETPASVSGVENYGGADVRSTPASVSAEEQQGEEQQGVCSVEPSTEDDRMISSMPVVAGASAQAGAGTGGPPQLSLVTEDEPVPKVVRHPVTVGRRKVTDAEHDLCDAILTHFNAAAGTRYSSVEFREKVIRRIREHPEMTAADHEAVIDRVFANPWWTDTPSPAVIYGNASIFERSIQTSTVVKKTKGERTWDMLRDMHAKAEAGEAW